MGLQTWVWWKCFACTVFNFGKLMSRALFSSELATVKDGVFDLLASTFIQHWKEFRKNTYFSKTEQTYSTVLLLWTDHQCIAQLHCAACTIKTPHLCTIKTLHDNFSFENVRHLFVRQFSVNFQTTFILMKYMYCTLKSYSALNAVPVL